MTYIVIGAGHNGLVTAAYLARAGKKVLVLERRAIPGGQLVTESLADGFQVDTLYAGAALRPDIIKNLNLTMPAASSAPRVLRSLVDGGEPLLLSSEPGHAETLASIARFSAKDAARWPEFVAFMHKAAGFLDAAYRTPMPRLPNLNLRSEGLPLAALALKLRRLGRKHMFDVIRMLPMTALELTEEWFESDAVRAAVASLGVHGVTLGSMSAGTGYVLLHNWLNRGGLAQPAVAGGVGAVTAALVAAVTSSGGEIRTGCTVKRVRVEHSRGTGVVLESGEEIAADVVISAADPRHTLLTLVGAPELPPEFVWQTQAIKMRGSVAKVHLLTDGSHGIPGGTVTIAPTIKYLERAFDAAKYGQISTAPYLEITTSGNTVSMHFQSAPYALRDGTWDDQRATLERIAVDTLAHYFPGLKASIRACRSITPRDLAETYGVCEGDLNHGQLLLDQFFFLRPLPGWSNHLTPIDNLYLCGSGVHGGGGISGASGRNAAQQILK